MRESTDIEVGRSARSVRRFAKDADLGESTVWKAIRERRLRAKKVGRRTIILDEDGKRYLQELPSARDAE